MPEQTQNKVKYGLSKVAFAVATIAADNSATYATPIMNPGARSISLEPQGELTKWPADNITYYIANNNNGYEGDLEVARFVNAVRAAIWKEATAANGITYENADTEVVHFALLFEFDGDVHKTRHVFYNCVATRPAVASATREDTTEPQTETTTVTSSSIYVPAVDANVVSGKCVTGDPAYENFYEAVVQPGAAAASETSSEQTTP